eukprot:6044691-Amphidinium_carterae.1
MRRKSGEKSECNCGVWFCCAWGVALGKLHPVGVFSALHVLSIGHHHKGGSSWRRTGPNGIVAHLVAQTS